MNPSTTVRFYSSIRENVKRTDTILDLGAGRAAWGELNDANSRMRNMSDAAQAYLGADVDPAIFSATVYDRVLLIENGVIPLEDNSVDKIISDFVFEHVADPTSFACEAMRILKTGGKLYARTPLRSNYVCVASRLISEKYIQWLLRFAQPDREFQDHFNVYYKLNTIADLKSAFSCANLSIDVVRTNPNYMVNAFTKPFLKALHEYGPKYFSGMLLIELEKCS